MRIGGPIPGLGAPRQHGLSGWWRAIVESTAPLKVSVPKLTGSGQAIPRVESVPFALGDALAVGDPVWVTCIEGNQDNLLVVARRVQ